MGLARVLHHAEPFMAKALRGETVVNLPQTSNNAGHKRLGAGPKGEIL